MAGEADLDSGLPCGSCCGRRKCRHARRQKCGECTDGGVIEHHCGWQIATKACPQSVAQLHSAQGVQACLHQRLVAGHLRDGISRRQYALSGGSRATNGQLKCDVQAQAGISGK